MKHKQTYFTLGSTFLVIFMMLGYVVKFYPEAVTGLDSSIQLSVCGDLPAHLTAFFKVITNFFQNPFLTISFSTKFINNPFTVNG